MSDGILVLDGSYRIASDHPHKVAWDVTGLFTAIGVSLLLWGIIIVAVRHYAHI